MRNIFSKINDQNKDSDLYRNYCQKIMKDYNLKDLNELQAFINRLLQKNMKNQKRVEKIKRLLLTEPITSKLNHTLES
jgi:hypothetical protein